MIRWLADRLFWFGLLCWWISTIDWSVTMKYLERTLTGFLVIAMFGVLLLIVSPVFAQAAHGFDFKWTDPTEREDGTALAVEELGSYRLQCASSQEAAEVVVSIGDTTVEAGVRSFFWESAVSKGGWYDCRMTAVDVNDLESDWSVTIQVRKLARPNPPGLR